MILEQIAADTRLRLIEEKKLVSPEEMKEKALALAADETFPFEKMLKESGIHYICEVKKASPSKGLIAEDFPYLQIAREYEQVGASAISVLTEPYRFLVHRRNARSQVRFRRTERAAAQDYRQGRRLRHGAGDQRGHRAQRSQAVVEYFHSRTLRSLSLQPRFRGRFGQDNEQYAARSPD